MFGNIAFVVKLLRIAAQFPSLVEKVREIIAAFRANDTVQVENLLEQLLKAAGVLFGGPVRFGSTPVPLGLPQACPPDVASALDDLEKDCCLPDGASVG